LSDFAVAQPNRHAQLYLVEIESYHQLPNPSDSIHLAHNDENWNIPNPSEPPPTHDALD
jgi:hypothetical protein